MLPHAPFAHVSISLLRRFWPVVATCCAGVIVVLIACALLWNSNSKSVGTELQNVVEGRIRTMQAGLARYEDIVSALRIYLSGAGGFPGTRKFVDLASGLLNQYQGTHALSWNPRVTSAERAKFEIAARMDGLPGGYAITDRTPEGRWIPAAERNEYFPIRAHKQFQDVNEILGFDLATEPERRLAIERARDTGTVAVTARVFLLTPGRDGGWGVLLFSPIYTEGAPVGTVEERRAALTGFATGVFRVDDMLESILRRTTVPRGLDQYVFDGPDADPQHLTHIHPSRLRASNDAPPAFDAGVARLGVTSLLTVADRQWAILSVPIPGMYSHMPPVEVWAVLLAGLAATALGTLYVFTILRRTERLADASRIIQASPTIVFRLAPDERLSLIYVSENVVRLGYTVDELLASPQLWHKGMHPEDLPITVGHIRDIIEGRSEFSHRAFRWIKPDGSIIWLDGRINPLRDSARRLLALEGTCVDVTDRMAAEEKVVAQARTDYLTALLNRTGFIEQLESAFAAAKRTGTSFSVLYLDLDYFKDVNDTLGHPMGDQLLQAVADRLKRQVRGSDIVARFGGDEFAVLQMGTADPSDAGALAAKLGKALRDPYLIDGNSLRVSVSIGISMFDASLESSADMLTQADLALYRAKDAGRDRYAFHSDDLDRIVRERVSLTEDLRAAIEKGGELEVHYQPQVEIASGRIVGVEALVRWNHPTRGQLMPADFVTVAERTGLINALGRWVMEESCRQMRSWRNEGIAPPVIAVNLSAVQLKINPEFKNEVMEIIANSDLSPGDVEVELTESVLMETTREHSSLLEELRKFGLRIAIDDFGTGYSSLEYLRSFQINRLKIAQQFVAGLPNDSGNVAIVRAALSLAHEFGIDVIAEGIETAEQAAFLISAGCKCAQGFYFSKPVPGDRATELLRQGWIDVGSRPIAAVR